MPTYSYQCKHCGHVLEAFQKMSDASLTDCPACSTAALEKMLFSAPSFKLKGGGWYKTDYAADKTAPVATPEKATDTKPASSSDTTH